MLTTPDALPVGFFDETTIDKDDHMAFDLFGLLGVKCSLLIQQKMMDQFNHICIEAVKSGQTEANEWLSDFMDRNVGKKAAQLMKEQNDLVPQLGIALCLKSQKGIIQKVYGSGNLGMRLDRKGIIVSYEPQRH